MDVRTQQEVVPRVTVLYFAYGSCMNPEDLRRDVPEFTIVGAALVRGFRLGFTRYSHNRRGGVADLVPDMHRETEGVLYRLPAKQLSALDEREGAPKYYRRDFIAVRTADGKLHDRVLTYVVARKIPVDIAPHEDYAAAVLSGAELYLSRDYVKRVRKLIEGLTEAQQERPSGRPRKGGRSRDRSALRNRMSPRGRSLNR